MNRNKRAAARKAAEERAQARARYRVPAGDREAAAEAMARSAFENAASRSSNVVEDGFHAGGLQGGGVHTVVGAIAQIVRRGYPNRRMRRFRDLLRLVYGRAPKLQRTELVVPLFLLTATPWLRDLEAWAPRGRGRLSLFRSLVRHLVVEYPTAPFLFSVFDLPLAPTSDRWVSLFARVAQGGSLRKLVADGGLPIPLTKRMCHLFASSSAHLSVIPAARYAQVRALGGDRVVAARLSETRLGRLAGDQEAFWTTAIQWFCAHPILPGEQCGPLVDYMAARRADDATFAVTGRSPLALLDAMRNWHGELARAHEIGGLTYDPAGWPGSDQVVLRGRREGGGKSRWTVRELLCSDALLAEGRAMHHCVYSYSRWIVRGRTSIWTVRCDGMRRVTVEVDNLSAAIVQVRGRCNRNPDPLEERVLRHWATEARLDVRARAW